MRLIQYYALFILRILSATALLSGCYFASGEKYSERALLHTNKNTEGLYLIEIHALPWFTGNGHIPFDFTVYENDLVYELIVPRKVGSFSASEITLRACGATFMVSNASVKLTETDVQFNIAYRFNNNTAANPHKMIGKLSLIRTENPVQACKNPPFSTN